MHEIIVAIRKIDLDALVMAITASANRHECSIVITNETEENPEMLQVTINSKSLYGLFELGMSFAMLRDGTSTSSSELN